MKSDLSLEKKVQYLCDRAEIENLMGTYVHYHFANDYGHVVQLFALDKEDVSAEIANWGVYKGKAGIERLYIEVHQKYLYGDFKGVIHANCLNTPVIHVAEDGKTAKGLWFMKGAATSPDDDGVFQPHWTLARYAVDFIKCGDDWKIWHMHTVGVFHTPFDTSWVDYELPHENLDWLPKELRSDEPMTYDYQYAKDFIFTNHPAVPEPYDTFENTFSYYER